MEKSENFIHDIFLLFLSLMQQDNQETMQRVFLEALYALVPECEFQILTSAEEDRFPLVQAIATNTGVYGYLVADENFAKLPPEQQSVLRNTAQLLSLLFENIHQRELLDTENQRLEAMITQKTSDLLAERTHLAERVDQRTAELTAAYLNLQEALRAREFFLANVSHELRTPLTAILGNAELLQMQTAGELTQKQQKYVNAIYQSGDHLHHLINDILALTRMNVESVQLDRTAMNVDEICQLCLDLLDTMAQKKKITLHYKNAFPRKTIMVDATRIKQVIMNLLSNAIKFTPFGGSVGISVSEDAGRKAVLLDVWDTGIGISEADQASLFQPFSQIDHDLDRQYDGTGLGLVIAQKMVELHGGTIHVESESGKGSHFIVQLSCE